MNQEELTEILSSDSFVYARELGNKEGRTLIYGYTLSRETFHLYLKDKLFHIHVYDAGYTYTTIKGESKVAPLIVRKEVSSSMLDLTDCVPDKRAYPERCDYEFCKLLKSKGVEIPFTVMDDLPKEMLERQFHGRLIGDTTLEAR